MKKPPYLCSRNQTTNTPKGKKEIQVKLNNNEALLLHSGERGQTPRDR